MSENFVQKRGSKLEPFSKLILRIIRKHRSLYNKKKPTLFFVCLSLFGGSATSTGGESSICIESPVSSHWSSKVDTSAEIEEGAEDSGSSGALEITRVCVFRVLRRSSDRVIVTNKDEFGVELGIAEAGLAARKPAGIRARLGGFGFGFGSGRFDMNIYSKQERKKKYSGD
jgi:hypothetical protein